LEKSLITVQVNQYPGSLLNFLWHFSNTVFFGEFFDFVVLSVLLEIADYLEEMWIFTVLCP
jgi:hypothetical protein